MKFMDWIRKRGQNLLKPGYPKQTEILKQTEALLGERDFPKLSELLTKYCDSEPSTRLIGNRMAEDFLICTPIDAMNRELAALMDTLRASPFIRQPEEQRTAPEYTPDRIDGMLAMYVFMCNAACCRFPECFPQRPDASEVRAATEVLDTLFREKNIRELTSLALYHFLPSDYVALRHGMAEDCDTVGYLREQSCALDDSWMEESPAAARKRHEHLLLLEARLERTAEKALETIMDGRLPAPCLEKLEQELQRLQCVPYIPRKEDQPESVRQLYYKYDILAAASREEQFRQVAKAFRELDARLVRMTGRQPYADDLFESLRRKGSKPEKQSSEKLQKDIGPALREQPEQSATGWRIKR